MLGVIPAHILEDIEAQTGKDIHELVDGMAGTSTGALIALMKAVPTEEGKPLSATKVKEFYRTRGAPIFEKAAAAVIGSLFGNKDFSSASSELKKHTEEVFAKRKISEALVDVMVLTHDLSEKKTYVFDSALAKENTAQDIRVSDAARASSSVRMAFGKVNLKIGDRQKFFVDAGSMGNSVQVNDPTPFLVEKLRLNLDPDDSAVIYSLGTGFSEAAEITDMPANIEIVRLQPNIKHLVTILGIDFLAADSSPETLNNMIAAADVVKNSKAYRRMLRDFLDVATKDEL